MGALKNIYHYIQKYEKDIVCYVDLRGGFRLCAG